MTKRWRVTVPLEEGLTATVMATPIKAELERKNREKAYKVMYQQEHSR